MRLPIASALLGCLLLLAGSAHAQTYVEFFELPGNPSLHGLDYHDGFLWAAASSSDPRILQIDPAGGSVVSEIALGGGFSPRGLTWDGTAFWASERFTSSPELFRVGTDGAILGQIPAPSQLSYGLAWRSDTLWVAKAYPDAEASIVGVDPADGSVLDTIPFPSTQPGGIAFLGDGTLWTDTSAPTPAAISRSSGSSTGRPATCSTRLPSRPARAARAASPTTARSSSTP